MDQTRPREEQTSSKYQNFWTYEIVRTSFLHLHTFKNCFTNLVHIIKFPLPTADAPGDFAGDAPAKPTFCAYL